METIQWSDSISVNNYAIDNQHKYLIQLVNNLILNSNAKVNSEIIGKTLQDLILFTRDHFRDEEALHFIFSSGRVSLSEEQLLLTEPEVLMVPLFLSFLQH